MLPVFSFNHIHNSRRTNSEFICKKSKGNFSANIFFSYFFHLFDGEDMLLNIYSLYISPISASSFFGAIKHVFGLRSQPQMLWINTSTIVAFVQYIKAVLDFPIMNLPGNSVRSLDASLETNSFINNPISIGRNSTNPIPTGRSFFNMFKESFFYGDNVFNHEVILI